MDVMIVQSNQVWENPEANRKLLGELLTTKASGLPDLVVLPEMFTTGFSMDSIRLAETMDGETVAWMKELAADRGFAICGSIIIEDNGRYFNRLLFVDETGRLESYDKAHLFRMEKENNFYSKGTGQLILKHRGFSINFQICYDLRFPVWSRNVNNNYDVLIYIASWPASRRHVWNTLLIARAIENQSYVIGVNRVGEDGNGISYSGDSVIIDPKGRIITDLDINEEGLTSANLSMDELISFREKFPVWKDSDTFRLTD